MKTYEVTHEGVTFLLEEDEDGGYVASVPDLPGCLSQGDNLDDALSNIQQAFELFVDSSLEFGHEIPERFKELRMKRAG